MAVLSSNIKYHPSGSSQPYLGGSINNSFEIPSGAIHSLFDPVRAVESLAGMTDYRCIYVRNTSGTDVLANTVVYVEDPPNSLGVSIELGVASVPVNGTEQVIPNENTAPEGVLFQSAPTSTSGIVLGDLGPNDYCAFWIKRIVAPNTSALASDIFTLTVIGETV